MLTTNTPFGLVTRNNPPSITPNKIIFSKVQFDLQPILDRFNSNIADIRNRFQITDYLLQSQTQNRDAAEDIWRSQIVFLDSALDFYIHEIVKYGIIKMFNGDWTESEGYKTIKVSLQFAIDLAQNPNSSSKLLDEIDEMNQRICCMGSKAVIKQFNFIGIKLSLTEGQAKLLSELYSRRNQIAHQSDRIHGTFNKTSIEKSFVEDKINKIERLVHDKLHPKIVVKG